MKKIWLLTVCALIWVSIASGFGQEIVGHYWGMYDDGTIAGYASITIDDTKIIVDVRSDTYTGKAVHSEIPYRDITDTPLEFIEMGNTKWLLLFWPDGIYLSDGSGLYSFLSRKEGLRTEPVDPSWTITASSFLTKEATQYVPGNLIHVSRLPWVSGNGYGIGDKLTIDLDLWPISMLSLNGYVDRDRPYLYYQNSRVRKMKITDSTSGRSKIVEVFDKPAFQRIDLHDIMDDRSKNGVLSIEILDVYKGNKYKDLCIQTILPDFSEVK